MLEGPTIAWGVWDEREYISGVSLWLASIRGGGQRVRLAKHWQIALRAEQEFGFRTADRNQVGLQIRYMSRRLLRQASP